MLHATHKRPTQESYPFSIAGLNVVMVFFDWNFVNKPPTDANHCYLNFYFIILLVMLSSQLTFCSGEIRNTLDYDLVIILTNYLHPMRTSNFFIIPRIKHLFTPNKLDRLSHDSSFIHQLRLLLQSSTAEYELQLINKVLDRISVCSFIKIQLNGFCDPKPILLQFYPWYLWISVDL